MQKEFIRENSKSIPNHCDLTLSKLSDAPNALRIQRLIKDRTILQISRNTSLFVLNQDFFQSRAFVPFRQSARLTGALGASPEFAQPAL